MSGSWDAGAGLGLRSEEHPPLGAVGWWEPAGPAGPDPLVVLAGSRGSVVALDAVRTLRDRGWAPGRPVAVAHDAASPDDLVVLSLGEG